MYKYVKLMIAAVAAVVAGVSYADDPGPQSEYFSGRIEFTIAGYAGASQLENFPVLIKLSEGVAGFEYSKCQQNTVRFFTPGGELLPFEIDTWNSSGVSYVWVNVPALSGTSTKIVMCYGNRGDEWPSQAGNLWTLAGYKSVWHLNIAEGETTDSVGSYTGTLLNPNEYCGGSTGIIGGDYLNVQNLDAKHCIKVTNMDAFTADPAGVVTYSGWVRQVGGTGDNTKPDPDNYPQIKWASQWGNCGAIWNSKNGNGQNSGAQGIELCLEGKAAQYKKLVIRDSVTVTQDVSNPESLYDKQWHYVVVRYNGSSRAIFIDGVQQGAFNGNGTVTTPTGTVRMGGRADSSADCTWTGDLDEMRYRGAASSDDWLNAEYANVNSYATFVNAIDVPFDDTEITLESDPVAYKSANGFTVSAKVAEGEGEISVIYGPSYPFANTNLISASVTAGQTYSLELTGLAADSSCGFGVYFVSTGGTAGEVVSASMIYTGEISVSKGADADESSLSTPGYFTVSRTSTATDGDVRVNFELGGTAVAGTHYVEIPDYVIIPDGEESVRVDVYPLGAHNGDHTLTLTVTNGAYNVGAQDSASILLKAFEASAGFKKKVEITVTGYTGSETLEDFPVLIRLSTAIEGFDYNDFQLANGGDLRFATESGFPLVHEIDTWNPAGESLVWVKIPELTNNMKIIAYFGKDDSWPVSATETWSDKYLGVWHFNEISNKVTPDSTGNELGMAGKDGLESVQVAVSGGQIGNALVSCAASGKTDGGFISPTYTSKFTSNKFTVSAWFNRLGHGINGYERYFSSKSTYDAKNGFEFENNNGNVTQCTVRGSAGDSVVVAIPDQRVAGWNKITLVYNGSKVTAYVNGVAVTADATITTVVHQNGFAVGNNAARNEKTFWGNIDEVRFAKSCESADWVKAEYDTESSANFVTIDAVEPVDAAAPVIAVPTVVRNQDGTYTVTTVISENVPKADTVKCVIGEAEYTMTTSDLAVPQTYSVRMFDLDCDRSYKYKVVAESVNGNVFEKKGAETFYVGDISIAWVSDAQENGLVPGILRVSRADTLGDLVVNFETNSATTAIVDQTYVALVSPVTITNGASSVDIEVVPLLDPSVKEDKIVGVNLLPGLYGIGTGSAQLTVVNLVAPTGFNTWIAQEDGKASVASNWSEGRVPDSSDNVLFDGRFTSANCEWDAGVNGLSAIVATWTQNNDYAGTITLDTVFPGKGEFTCLTVTGAMTIDAGTITHPQSRRMSDNHNAQWDWLGDLLANETYRVRIAAGSLSIGSNGAIDVKTKGYYASHDSARCYASHGGRTNANAPRAYGDPKEPIHIGLPHRTAGSYYNGKGGGAIYITVSGAAVVNGAICADSGNSGYGAGAAGSVYLNATSVTGAGSITARGSATGEGNYKGCGGRVAIITQTAVNRGTFAAISAESEWKNSQGSRASEYGGPGTVYFKDSTMTNGKLVIAAKSDITRIDMTKIDRQAFVGTDGDWIFDSLEIGKNSFLAIPVGAALHLPNGLTSVSGTGSGSDLGGILYEGGTLDIGSVANQTIAGNWILCGWSNLVLNANITVSGNGVIGVPSVAAVTDGGSSLPLFLSSSVAINGNLSVASDGRLLAINDGCRKGSQWVSQGVLGHAAHGGRILSAMSKDITCKSAYDSVFAPCLPGCSIPWPNGQAAGECGGVMKLVVSGAFTINGVANASGSPEAHSGSGNAGGGAGGAIDITAGSISGNGKIAADGGSYAWLSGPGGRVAIKLTDANADFSGFTGVIRATGRSRGSDDKGSAGTVYLKVGNESAFAGTLNIACPNYDSNENWNNKTSTTEIVSLGYGGDSAADMKQVKLVVSDFGRAAVNVDVKFAALNVADENSFVDFEGNTLTVKKASVNGVNVPAGEYTIPANGAHATYSALYNSSDTAGKLVVAPNGLKLVIR